MSINQQVRIIETVFPTDDVVLANIVATEAPYGCDPTGEKDSTAALQQAINDCAEQGGGVVYLPVGRYTLTDTVKIPHGVALRGDWQDPDALADGEKLTYGTVLLAKLPALAEGAPLNEGALLYADTNTGVIGVTVYYPEQSAKDPKPYGFAYYAACVNTATIRNVTLINAYRGIAFDALAEGHEMAKLEHIRMTALENGTTMHRSSEVGYTFDFNVSPSYWINAGEGYTPDDADAVKAYCRTHCLAMFLGDLDLEVLSEIRLECCHTGILFDRLDERAGFWGEFYDIYITDCDYGVVSKVMSPVNPPIFARGRIEGAVAAVDSVYTDVPIRFCDIELVGERIGCVIEEDEDLSAYPMTHGTFRRPAANLYVAPIAEYAFKDVDVADYIQETLDKAAATGGVVYLPAGAYTVCKPLNVPCGVQLTGSIPVAITNYTQRSTMILSYGEGDLITLQSYAGVSGLRIFYPAQPPFTAEAMYQNGEPKQTAVRGAGEGVYALETVVTCGFVGVDFTGCDRHFVRSVYGCCYTSLVKCGGVDGYVEECLSNQHYVLRNVYRPFFLRISDAVRAEWEDIASKGEDITINRPLARMLQSHCNVYHVVNATRQKLNNCFMYAARVLITCENSTDVQFLNDSVDVLPGTKPMYDMRYSTGFAAGAMRVFGTSVSNIESTFDIVARNDRREAFEKPYHSSVSVEDIRIPTTEFTQFVKLFNCDTTDNMIGATLCTDPDFVREGTGAWVNEIHGDAPKDLFECHFDPVDISAVADGYLHLWFYCDDIEKLGDGQIELTSSGHQDVEEHSFGYLNSLFHNGWNEVYIPMHWADRSPEPWNPKAINFMRIYADFGDCKVAIDDIYICK